jgi:pimeloyl-ACP methyl ester carboxylesterase
MKDTLNPLNETIEIPTWVNFIKQGEGSPVIMIHGLAASLHDWDELIPELVQNGYSVYALDLLGHGDSPHPESRAYQIEWMFAHLTCWIDSLGLTEAPVLIGHSLGGYLALEYACRFPARTRGLILIDPFYRLKQLPAILRLSYRHPSINATVVERTPEWLFRIIIDATSLSMGHSNGGAHNLAENIRAQTALDYKRTAAGVYNLPNTIDDMTSDLPSISQPTLVVWGTRDSTLAPASFTELVAALPNATAKLFVAGHVPHQSHPLEFNQLVVEFLEKL